MVNPEYMSRQRCVVHVVNDAVRLMQYLVKRDVKVLLLFDSFETLRHFREALDHLV